MRDSACVFLIIGVIVSACGDSATAPRNVPPPPADFFATSRTGEISLRWRDVSANEESYRVEVRTDNGPWLLLKETSSNATTVTHSGVIHGTTYQYRIQACNASGCSAWIETSGKWEGGQAPVARAPRVVGLGNSFVRVDYDANTGGLPTALSVAVRKPAQPFLFQTNPILFQPHDGIGEIGDIQGSTAHIFNLEPLTDYEIVTIATNLAGSSYSVATRFRTTGLGLPVLTNPGVFATLVTDTSAVVVVSVDLKGSVAEVWIERVVDGGDFSQATRSNTYFLEPNTFQTVPFIATLSGLKPGTKYQWRAAAKNTVGTTYSEIRDLTTRSN